MYIKSVFADELRSIRLLGVGCECEVVVVVCIGVRDVEVEMVVISGE